MREEQAQPEGARREIAADILGPHEAQKVCSHCGGTGYRNGYLCYCCGGSGKTC